jgi:HSP20 family protein
LGRRLTVSGTRRDCCLDEGVHYRMEIPYSHFQRSVDLPIDLTLMSISTELRHGMLLVRVAPEARA